MTAVVQEYNTITNPIPSGTSKVVLYFWASWHEGSTSGSPLDVLFTTLATNLNSDNIEFGRVNVDDNNDTITELYGVTSVPTFVFLNTDGTVVEKICITVNDNDNSNYIANITQAVQRLSSSTSTSTVSTPTTTTAVQQKDEETLLKERLHKLINTSDVMIFVKGTVEQPRCGFSRQIIEILQKEQIPFATFDILQDETVRQGLKSYSNWPTYPQIYVHGELIGGLDIIKDLLEDGPLATQWNIIPSNTETTTTKVQSIEDKCQELMKQERIMLFMKGLPSSPRCGFSRKIVEILDSLNISYGSFDILQDEDVRQTLKQLSTWPTYPQLYVDGTLIGGLDIIQELYDDGTLVETLQG
jgi:Grx4 family monothiol glutaredoxin